MIGPIGEGGEFFSGGTSSSKWLAFMAHADRLTQADKAWLESIVRDIERDLGCSGVKDATKEQPWADDAPEYLSLSEARKLIDGRFSLQTLSRLCKHDGRIRYMHKGQRSKIHAADFREHMKGQQSDPEWAAAYMNWLNGQKAGTVRVFWKCKACGHDYPDNANATVRCPKCGKQSILTPKTAPKPGR